MSDDARQRRINALYERCLENALELLDKDRHLIALPSASDPDVTTYWPAGSLPLAHALLNDGDTQQHALGIKIIEAVLDSQETRPEHPHCGNWTWLADDPEVGDLNAIQFVLRWFLPLLIEHSGKLPDALLERCVLSIKLSLEEQERMQVAPIFSNIHISSLFTLLVGAEWLEDDYFFQVGQKRWKQWVAFTLSNGAPHEYNSPDYLGWQLSALALIHQYTQNEQIRLQAGLLYERFWLHAGLHIHQPTGQIAGPHSRSYWHTMTSGRGMTKDTLWLETGYNWAKSAGAYGGDDSPPSGFLNLSMALGNQHIPDYLKVWLENQTNYMPYEVRETANHDENFDLMTYYTESYALGTASNTYAIGTDCFYIEHESNYLMLHYKRPESDGGWGMMYSRFVVNDRHWGTLGPAPDRPKTGNFYDHGHFAGVQNKNKAIGLYALMPEQEEVFSIKTVLAFQSGQSLDKVWINDRAIDHAEIGQELSHGDWLIVEDGDVYIAIQPLKASNLSVTAPIRLERGPLGELWLSIYNYEGAAIRFWDYASLKGAFWRGNIKAGFVIEVAEKSDFASATEFLKHLTNAQISDSTDDSFIRTVSYTSGNDNLSLRYDLWNTKPRERYISGQEYHPPHLTSPIAVQGDTGYLTVGKAQLFTSAQSMWLIAEEARESFKQYIAVNPTNTETTLSLETPYGTVSADTWGLGRIEWQINGDGQQRLIIHGRELPLGLSIPDGVAVELKSILF